MTVEQPRPHAPRLGNDRRDLLLKRMALVTWALVVATQINSAAKALARTSNPTGPPVVNDPLVSAALRSHDLGNLHEHAAWSAGFGVLLVLAVWWWTSYGLGRAERVFGYTVGVLAVVIPLVLVLAAAS